MRKFSALLILLLLLPIVFSKSYKYDYINVNVTFEKNGSVLVEQERTYNFRGDFSYAYLNFSKEKCKDIEFISIKDADTNSEPIYKIENNSEYLKLTWYYKASYEVKRFRIVYRIIGAVEKYEDVAQFYWKIIESEHAPIRKLHILFTLPQQSPELFKIFVHSSAEPGKIEFNEDYSQAEVMMTDIDSGFVETRVLVSPDVFPDVETKPIKNYENILSEEKEIFLSSQPSTSPIRFWVVFLLGVLPICAIYIYYYSKYGKEYEANYNIIYEHEPPSNIPPLALINLFEQEKENILEFSARGFLATVFDLARRGYIEVYEIKRKRLLSTVNEQKFVLTKEGMKELKERTKLKDFEIDVLNFLFKIVKNSTEVTITDIKEYAENYPESFKKFLENINDKAHEWFVANYFPVYEELSEKKKNEFMRIMLIYSILASVPIYFLEPPVLVLMIMFVIFFYLLARKTLSKKTERALIEAKRWEAFKRFISDFSAMEKAPSTLLHIWDEYLVYAIALGVAEELLKNMKRLAQEANLPVSAPWYHTPSGRIDTMSLASLTALTTNISNTMKALSTATSVGGGFSGGGGGGGGGGSSGAG
jgi:uncharacterized membrane protein